MRVEDNPQLINEANILNKKYTELSGFDPFTILLLISVVISLLRLIQGCRKNQKLVRKVSNTAIGRMRIAGIVKAHLTDEQYTKGGRDLIQAIIQRIDELDDVKMGNLSDALDG